MNVFRYRSEWTNQRPQSNSKWIHSNASIKQKLLVIKFENICYCQTQSMTDLITCRVRNASTIFRNKYRLIPAAVDHVDCAVLFGPLAQHGRKSWMAHWTQCTGPKNGFVRTAQGKWLLRWCVPNAIAQRSNHFPCITTQSRPSPAIFALIPTPNSPPPPPPPKHAKTEGARCDDDGYMARTPRMICVYIYLIYI